MDAKTGADVVLNTTGAKKRYIGGLTMGSKGVIVSKKGTDVDLV